MSQLLNKETHQKPGVCVRHIIYLWYVQQPAIWLKFTQKNTRKCFLFCHRLFLVSWFRKVKTGVSHTCSFWLKQKKWKTTKPFPNTVKQPQTTLRLGIWQVQSSTCWPKEVITWYSWFIIIHRHQVLRHYPE